HADLPRRYDLALHFGQERIVAVLGDGGGIHMRPGLQPDAVGPSRIEARIPLAGETEQAHFHAMFEQARLADPRALRQFEPAGAGEKAVDRVVVLDVDIGDLPRPRLAEAGYVGRADHRRVAPVVEDEDAAEMAGPEGIVPEDQLVGHQAVLPDVAGNP